MSGLANRFTALNKQQKMFYADMLLLMVTFFWGITFVIVKESVLQIGVFPFLTQRFFFSTILLLPLVFLKRRQMKKKTLLDGFILGVLLFGGFSLQTIALLYTTASNTAFLTGLNVVFVPLISIWLLKQKISYQIKIGVLLAVTGLYLLCSANPFGLNTGDLWAIAGALCTALHIIYTSKFSHRNNIILLTTLQLGIITLLSFSITVYQNTTAIKWYPSAINAILFCAIFATCLAFLVQTFMQRHISPTQTSLIFSMEPVFAAVYAYVIIDERLGYKGGVGATLVFAGMILAQLSPQYKGAKNYFSR